jgi:hypothetical protein
MTQEEAEIAVKMGVSIMSGKGTGKDGFAAWMILWFLFCFPNVKIPCTANSGKQLSEVLWSEVAKWLENTHIEEYIVLQAEKAYFKDETIPKEKWGKRDFAVCRTVNVQATAEAQANTLTGFHEDYQMFVVDEASGIPEAVFSAFETTLTGSVNFVLMIFNPTRSTGYAIDSHGKDRENWMCLHWDAEKSDLIMGNPQGEAQIKRVEAKYGRNSAAFRISVTGLPPLAEKDTLIPIDWIWAAVDRDIEPEDGLDPMMVGLDIGAGGDKSIFLRRQGGKVFGPIDENNSPNTMVVTGWAVKLIMDWEVDATFVDIIGLGNGVYNRLRELGRTKVYPVDARKTANNEARFKKVRDELWYKVRDQFEAGTIAIPNDEELIFELANIKEKESESDGKIKIEGKRELKKRGLESPNKADALCLSFARPDAMFRKEKADKDMDALLDEDDDTDLYNDRSYLVA